MFEGDGVAPAEVPPGGGLRQSGAPSPRSTAGTNSAGGLKGSRPVSMMASSEMRSEPPSSIVLVRGPIAAPDLFTAEV